MHSPVIENPGNVDDLVDAGVLHYAQGQVVILTSLHSDAETT